VHRLPLRFAGAARANVLRIAHFDLTPASTLYPPEAIAATLESISPQGLWLLLSLDQYGWRVEYDAIRIVLGGAPTDDGGHYRQHAPLLALGHHFALTDKLWRLVYGMRAHRAGHSGCGCSAQHTVSETPSLTTPTPTLVKASGLPRDKYGNIIAGTGPGKGPALSAEESAALKEGSAANPKILKRAKQKIATQEKYAKARNQQKRGK
jgi:hypothetical protein